MANSTFKVRTRFSWTDQGINGPPAQGSGIDFAGHRREMAVVAAENNNPAIHVLRADFVLDGKDHIEWIVETDAADGPTAVNTVDQFIKGLADAHHNISYPRKTELVQ
jgi:hypothetical protein